MRNSPKVELVEVDGEIIGFALSADYVSEHEWGIKHIKRAFNIDNTPLKTLVQEGKVVPTELSCSKDSQNLYIVKDKKHLYLCSSNNYGTPYTSKDFSRQIYMSDSKDFGGAWDDSEFAICAKNTKENLALFKMLIEAEKANDIFIGFFPEVLKTGLLVVQCSKISQEARANYAASVKESVKMYEEAFASDIFSILKKAGKGWHYLEPSFFAKENGFHSAYKSYEAGTLLYWLNPENQKVNSSGYYSVEELLLWAEDKGPVLERMKKDAA